MLLPTLHQAKLDKSPRLAGVSMGACMTPCQTLIKLIVDKFSTTTSPLNSVIFMIGFEGEPTTMLPEAPFSKLTMGKDSTRVVLDLYRTWGLFLSPARKALLKAKQENRQGSFTT